MLLNVNETEGSHTPHNTKPSCVVITKCTFLDDNSGARVLLKLYTIAYINTHYDSTAYF